MEERWRNVKKLADIPDTEEGYPPPSPPLQKKSDIFNASDFVDIDKRAKDASDDLSKTWEGLHGYLFDGLTSDLQKVRALYIWLGTRKLADNFEFYKSSDSSPAGSPNALVKELLENYCLELPALFAHLCRSANLPCVVMRGLEKFRTYLDDDDWNSVYVDGSWRFVHTHRAFVKLFGPQEWTLIEDCGIPERQRSDIPFFMVKQFPPDEFMFLMDPELSIANYFPKKGDDWQLLPEPWSLQRFKETPEFYESYFFSSWHLAAKHKLCEIIAGGKCCITFDKIPEKTREIKYRLFFNEEKSKGRLPADLQLTNYVIFTQTLDTKSLMIRLPVAGVYRLDIFDGNLNELCRLRLECSDKIKQQKPFPDIPEQGFGFSQEAMDSGLVDASREEGMVVAREGEKIRFKFHTSCPLQVQARLVHRFLQSQQLESRVTQEEDEHTVTVVVKVPYDAQNPEFTLQMNAKPKDSEKEFVNVLNYLLTPDRELVYADKGQAEKVQAELKAAMKDDDVHRLESAVREFRAAGDVSDDSRIINQAYVRLRDLHLTAIKNALESQMPDKIDTALSEVDASAVAYFVHRSPLFQQAQDSLRRMRRLAGVRHLVKELSGSQVSEVQTYNHPHPGVRATVVATFLLLGESQKALKKWNFVQSLLRRHGQQSIRHRIQSHDATKDLDSKRLQSAATLLDSTTSEEVHSLSIGAAAFYNWSKAVVDSAMEERGQESVSRDGQDEENNNVNNNNNTSNTNDATSSNNDDDNKINNEA